MIAEYGHVALIIALCLSVAQAIVPMAGSFAGYRTWMRLGHSLALGQLVFVAISFACLTAAFLQDDFSLQYVANNSNTLLPTEFKISAVWGAHEGSLLLWALILAVWSAAVALFSGHLPLVLSSRVLSILGAISVGFGLFILLTSNPFARILPFSPTEGGDLNPLLQDFGLIVHPPMLYMGYVGFSVAFAFAVAALIGGQFDSAWARWARPWINSAWVFLTVGITLGSWWAYYELGWGGWWFWDPVENASLMPWLVGTALVHSISVTEKRGAFRSWTLLLAILAFSLSLLGTFLVRSGVLTSVHAFANDPERGIFILAFLGLVVGSSLLLFALRGPVVQRQQGDVEVVSYSGLSREMILLLNNVLLVSAMAMILIGTLYPLIADVLELGKISVGPPYFNFFFVPMTLGLMVAMGFAVFSRWKKTDALMLRQKGMVPFLISLGAALILPLFLAETISWESMSWEAYSITAAITLGASFWVVTMSIEDLWQKLDRGYSKRDSSKRGSSKRDSRLKNLTKLPGSYWGMQVAHIGIAVCALGVGLSSVYDVQKDVRMVPGDRVEVAGYEFTFDSLDFVQGPNFGASRGQISAYKNDRLVAVLYPEKRKYEARNQVMTEAALDAGLTRDLYVSLGEPLKGDAWAIRLHVKPFVRCIWLGGLMIGLGGLLSVMDKRYRRRRQSGAKLSAQSAAAEAVTQ
ncbi:cytochrome C-type biogenesis protein CcmF [gamma proteobacterium HTCC2207]|uniref:Cytochrome C-type biogenesis protein CcmF n=1 Tax=gamma proteobacterium HTCC2207 TaxID=314287 RepID=Q1YRU9_9GAMM|nr:cytochrome C-type biogenesis protein CcmF [gamma proteobacterium HTCC2207]